MLFRSIPLFAWNVLYMTQYFAKTYLDGEDVLPITEILTKFCLFDFNGFMWFFVPLILIYLSLPFVAVLCGLRAQLRQAAASAVPYNGLGSWMHSSVKYYIHDT